LLKLRRTRWILALLLAFTMIAAACGGDDEEESTGTTGGTSETTEAPSDGGDDEGDGSDVTVGLVYDLGGRGDQSFNDAAAAGLDQAVEEFGIATEELEPDAGGENREELLRLLSEQNTNLVFAVGFLFTESVQAVAPEFGDVSFGLIDSVVEEDNVASLLFAEEQGSFLVGAAAALTSKTGKIGFIGGVETPLIKKFEAGYRAGAEHVNADIEITATYLTQPPDFSGFNDPAKGKVAAEGMYDAGVDVIYHAAGGSGGGMFEAAKEHTEQAADEKVWGIGVDSDQFNTVAPELQEFVLTSMLKKVDVAVYETIKQFIETGEIGGITTFDLESGGVDYSTSGDFLSDDIISQLDELKEQIISGEITVPTE
jgi:basic membrane protein A and related proteins